jgi:hypothetical protein
VVRTTTLRRDEEDPSSGGGVSKRFEIAPLVGLVERMGGIGSLIFGIDLCGPMSRKKGCQRLIDEFGITRSGPRAPSVVK